MPRQPLSILICDDSEPFARFVGKALESADFPIQCTLARNTTHGIQLLRSDTFDMAFVDADLEPDTGVGLVTEARKAGARTTFVIMAEELDDERIATARSAGAYECVAKPFQPDRALELAVACNRLHKRATILLVDDSKSTRSVIKRVLKSSCFTLYVEEADSGEAALAKFNPRRHDLVLLDVNMPGIGGRETFARLRDIAPDLPVILSTGDTPDRIEREFGEDLTGRLLRKPYFVHDLDSLLHDVFGLKPPTFGDEDASAAFV